MFIGDRRTKHAIRVSRSPGTPVMVPTNAILHDVRTRVEPGYPFPIAMSLAARQNPSMHIFEYEGETLYMHFTHGLIEATTEIMAK